jgi:hypothetical protein
MSNNSPLQDAIYSFTYVDCNNNTISVGLGFNEYVNFCTQSTSTIVYLENPTALILSARKGACGDAACTVIPTTSTTSTSTTSTTSSTSTTSTTTFNFTNCLTTNPTLSQNLFGWTADPAGSWIWSPNYGGSALYVGSIAGGSGSLIQNFPNIGDCYNIIFDYYFVGNADGNTNLQVFAGTNIVGPFPNTDGYHQGSVTFLCTVGNTTFGIAATNVATGVPAQLYIKNICAIYNPG